MPKEATKVQPVEPAAANAQSIELLRPDKNNARTMPRDRRAKLKFSMHEFGDLSGIVWNKKLGELVGGHQRRDQLAAAGAKSWVLTSPTEGYIIHPKTDERFNIRIVDWDPEKHRQAQIVANNPHLQGEYSEDLVAQLREQEDSLMFSVLGLDDLQKEVDEDLKRAEKELRKGSAGDQSGQLKQKFSIVIECSDEAQQRELLERFSTEGIDARALF